MNNVGACKISVHAVYVQQAVVHTSKLSTLLLGWLDFMSVTYVTNTKHSRGGLPRKSAETCAQKQEGDSR